MTLLASPALAEDGTSGVWTWRFEPSSIGEGGLVTALAPSPTPPDGPNDPGYMIARCLGGRSEFLVGGSGGWGLSGRQLDVVTQIDGAGPVTARWDVASNGKAVFVSEKVEEFLRALPDAGKLRVEIHDGTGTVRATVFSTAGFGSVREKIAQACGWKK